MITTRQVELLSEQSPQTLVEWWDALNTWKWVDALGPPDPIPNPWHPNTLRAEIMRWVEGKVGMEYILRVCNVLIRKAMTDEEFTAWWRNRDRKYSE